MPRLKYVTLACAALAVGGVAQAKPTLIVAIAVDQFSSDLFNEYRATYAAGLKRLASGVVFARGHQSHAATETCPGHSTILTGSRPARTGIIANNWIDPAHPRTGKAGTPDFTVYCAEDATLPGTNSSQYIVSSVHLKVPTLGDRIKVVTPASRVVGISGKDRAAVMMAGHHADLTLWWDGKAFVTYPGSASVLPAGLAAINARASAAVAKPVTQKLPSACATHSRAVPISPTASVGTLAPRKPGDARGWRATPEFDAMTIDVALAALGEMKLGKGDATDVLALSLSATDYVGHTFGTEGAEMCAQIVALDATIGRLMNALDKTRVDYVVVLTADHGGHDLPERNAANALPAAQRVDVALAPAAVGAALARQFGLTASAILGDAPFGDMYLSRDIAAAQRGAVRDAAVATYRAHRQVAAVFTRDEIIAAPPPAVPVDEWSLIERVKASFDPDRSGDFVVLLKPYVTPIPSAALGYVATHGSAWGYDRRVPILFWRAGLAGFEQPNAVETVDILPTLASLIGLTVPPAEIDGRCLDLIAGADSNC